MADKQYIPIVRSEDFKKGLIIYEAQDKRMNLPKYTSLHIDKLKVSITLADGSTRWLPDLSTGYILKEANKYQIVFQKIK